MAINPSIPTVPSRKGRDPWVEHFDVESDRRLGNSMLFFLALGIAMGFYITTIEFVVPRALYAGNKEDTSTVVMKIDEVKKEEKKKPDEKKKPKVVKKTGAGGKPRGKGNPNALATQGVLKLISSRSNNSALSSYDLMNSKFAKDIDKVIQNVSGLTKSGQTRLGGRRGRADGGFNEGYAVGGSGGVDDMLGGLLGGDAGGPLSVKAKGNLKAPSASDIDMGQASGQRSTESILRVIRQHTPGLRHTYNKYLKLNPGFKGKVTIRFSIAPSGSIVELGIVSSTTGVGDFDDEIRDKIRTWRFEPVKGKGNDTVTVPFTFSE